MPTEPESLTLAEAVHKAVEVCDDGSEGLDDLLVRFEDADEPIAAIGDVQERLDRALGPAEADELEPAVTMARAVVLYLAYRRDEIDAEPAELLRLAARAEFDAHPSEPVARWLELQGVTDA